MSLATVKVFMLNPANNYSTSVNPKASSGSVAEYFIGSFFNVSKDPDGEQMDQCVGIIHEVDNKISSYGKCD